MPPLCPPCSLPRRCRSLHQLRSDDGSSGCGPHESHILIKTGIHVSDVVKYKKKLFCTQTNWTQHASAGNTDKSELWIKQRQGEGEVGRYYVMKGDQMMSHTFLWAGHHHLSSSARWELGHLGPHTWTLHFGPLTPPGCPGDEQSWDALHWWKKHTNETSQSTE